VCEARHAQAHAGLLVEQGEQNGHAPVAHGANHQRAGVLQLDVAEAPRAVGIVEGRIAPVDPEGLPARVLQQYNRTLSISCGATTSPSTGETKL
jgi:hypothetical protein